MQILDSFSHMDIPCFKIKSGDVVWWAAGVTERHPLYNNYIPEAKVLTDTTQRIEHSKLPPRMWFFCRMGGPVKRIEKVAEYLARYTWEITYTNPRKI